MSSKYLKKLRGIPLLLNKCHLVFPNVLFTTIEVYLTISQVQCGWFAYYKPCTQRCCSIANSRWCCRSIWKKLQGIPLLLNKYNLVFPNVPFIIIEVYLTICQVQCGLFVYYEPCTPSTVFLNSRCHRPSTWKYFCKGFPWSSINTTYFVCQEYPSTTIEVYLTIRQV